MSQNTCKHIKQYSGTPFERPPLLERPFDNVNLNINVLISTPDERPPLLRGHFSDAKGVASQEGFICTNQNFGRCREVEGYTLYPWVSQFCNNMKSEDQLRPAKFPDINPSCLHENAQFSMAAGDFLEVYTEPGK